MIMETLQERRDEQDLSEKEWESYLYHLSTPGIRRARELVSTYQVPNDLVDIIIFVEKQLPDGLSMRLKPKPPSSTVEGLSWEAYFTAQFLTAYQNDDEDWLKANSDFTQWFSIPEERQQPQRRKRKHDNAQLSPDQSQPSSPKRSKHVTFLPFGSPTATKGESGYKCNNPVFEESDEASRRYFVVRSTKSDGHYLTVDLFKTAGGVRVQREELWVWSNSKNRYVIPGTTQAPRFHLLFQQRLTQE